jgi:hypothetical protein
LGFLADQIYLFAPAASLLLGGNINNIHPYENIFSKKMLLLKNKIEWKRMKNYTSKKNKKI